jgi:hypothetical protein
MLITISLRRQMFMSLLTSSRHAYLRRWLQAEASSPVDNNPATKEAHLEMVLQSCLDCLQNVASHSQRLASAEARTQFLLSAFNHRTTDAQLMEGVKVLMAIGSVRLAAENRY